MTNHPTRLGNSFIRFIEAQQMFFVATAAPSGRVNLSPKGMTSLKVMSPERILWLNLSGSGNETAAHLRESDRMTLMFCAFEGPAKILRVYGQAKAYHPRDPEWAELASYFPAMAGARQIFDLAIDLVQVSCGTGVPHYEYQGQRGPEELEPFYAKMGPDGVREYWRKKNQVSVDGRPTGIFGD